MSAVRNRLPWLLLIASGLSAWVTSGAVAAENGTDKLEFNRDIRPILSDKCFVCHGPDSGSRQADLRLDLRADAVAEREAPAIVPGQSRASEVYRRITSADPDERMPPNKSGLKLTTQEIETLRRWIDQGAEYQPHWSFIAPVRPTPPRPTDDSVIANPIDGFVRARLGAEGFEPSPPADPVTLLRRVTFDLTGLPPTLAEVDAFLANTSADAYEQAVDRLLASPRYGERMATLWLDAARYADTNGYQTDEQRYMWRWRDWVIEAFNRNLPFDQFTVEQLAGDLLPNATLDQKIATGFNRNHRANSEGGIIPEEFLVEYAVDRLDTTATVWLGLTIGCARCHDHKYDPISQREFYSLLAFFNNVPEQGKVTRSGNAPPTIKAPTSEIAVEVQQHEAALAEAQQRWNSLAAQLETAQHDWESSFPDETEHRLVDDMALYFTLDGAATAIGARQPAVQSVGGDAAFVVGRLGDAAQFTGDRFLDAGDVAAFVETDKFSYGAWIYPQSAAAIAVLSRMDENTSYIGYDLFLDGGKVQADLAARLLDDSLRVETVDPLALDQWHHVFVTYDGSRSPQGLRIYVDGARQPLRVIAETLSNPIKTSQPLRIGSRGTGSRFQGRIDDVRFYGRQLSDEEVATLACTDSIAMLVKLPNAQRTMPQSQKLRSYFLEYHAPETLQQSLARLEVARRERQAVEERIPTTMVMQENRDRRETFVLIRGQYDKPGERVEPDVPTSLPPLPDGVRRDRLALARWLVDPRNPLTVRVTVNRFWQMFFGVGLVKTTEDFGSQGERPAYPELLDWLADEFIRTGWGMKRLHKTIVTSATYRQSSKVSPMLLARDPENRLLARGPRHRLSAEMIRDGALAIGGLLVEKVGGPSVKPYQPPGLWEELTVTSRKYPQDQAAGLYRRSLYTFWKRTIPPPAMMIFDAAGREMCSVRQSRTNTPLQALALLNDVGYVESARALAERVLSSRETASDVERLALMFRQVTARTPRAKEAKILQAALAKHLARYRQHPEAAEKLLTVGESPRPESLDVAELAAYTVVASTILNLDETVTKE